MTPDKTVAATLEEMDTADVLDAAADYLRVHGWTRGSYNWPMTWHFDSLRDSSDGDGPCCTIGALHRSDTQERIADTERSDALTALAEWLHIPERNMTDWNDAPERTADEVITALMECAADLRLRAAARGAQ